MMIENGGRWSFEGGCQLPVIGRRRRQLPKENTSHCQEESLGKTNCQFKKEFLADESDMYYLLCANASLVVEIYVAKSQSAFFGFFHSK